MPEDEETPRAPGVLGDGILQDGQDSGAARRTAIREANARRQQAEADRAAQKSQDRAQRPQRGTVPGKPAAPLVASRVAERTPLHPDGQARLLEALGRRQRLYTDA